VTRKRFIKLIMSKGASRNEAVSLANRLPPGQSYKVYIWPILLGVSFNAMGVSARKAAKAITKFSVHVATVCGCSTNNILAAIRNPIENGKMHDCTKCDAFSQCKWAAHNGLVSKCIWWSDLIEIVYPSKE